MKRTLQNNITALYTIGFFQAFIVVIPVFVPLLQGYGLSMSQVLQTQALFALTIAICEVPSGYIADMWGRRNAILVGGIKIILASAMGLTSYLIYADVPSMAADLIQSVTDLVRNSTKRTQYIVAIEEAIAAVDAA